MKDKLFNPPQVHKIVLEIKVIYTAFNQYSLK